MYINPWTFYSKIGWNMQILSWHTILLFKEIGLKPTDWRNQKLRERGRWVFPTCHHSLSQTPAVVLCLSVSLVNSPLATSFSRFWCSDLSSCSCGLHEKGTGKWCVLTNCQARIEGPANHIYQVRRSKWFLKYMCIFIRFLSPFTLNPLPFNHHLPWLFYYNALKHTLQLQL